MHQKYIPILEERGITMSRPAITVMAGIEVKYSSLLLDFVRKTLTDSQCQGVA